MGKTVMGAVMSLDGYMADDNDGIGPMFDWMSNGTVEWTFEGQTEMVHTTQASADFMVAQYKNMACVVIGRRLFDLTNGWNGVPAAGEHVFVVTHEPPTDWEFAGTAPFTFVDSVESGIAAAQEFAGDRIDEVVISLVPTVFGSGRPFFNTGTLPAPILLENPSQVVQGDRVTHLVFDVRKN